MLKQIWIAECDLCGASEPAQAKIGRYNDTDYELPVGWKQGHNKDFCVCPDCAQKVKVNSVD